MSDITLPWFGFFDRLAYAAFGAFLTVIGSLLLINARINSPLVVVALALFFAGAPLIIGTLTNRAMPMRLFMLATVLVILALGYFNRVVVPDIEPEKASAFATVWLDKLSTSPDDAFTVFLGPAHEEPYLIKQIKKVDMTKLKIDRIDEFAPQTVEGRGDCNNYHVWFLHPAGSARVGLHQCYNGGPEFEVTIADVTIDSEVVENAPRPTSGD